MTKRVFLLNAIAILSVICNHAASWGNTAMFWWTDRYLPVTVPNFDQIGTLTYYVLSAVRKLTAFSVPAFLFVSGFFVAYASRGGQSAPNWKVVKTRVTNLLVPYLIWSVVIFAADALQGTVYTPVEYLVQLVSVGASGGFYFVPLLCQYYLLAPLVIPIARTRWRQVLLVSALLQLVVLVSPYSRLWETQAPVFDVVRRIAPEWSFLASSFFFALGLVFRLQLQQFKQWLARCKWALLAAVIVLGALALFEAEVVFRSTGRDWHDSVHTIAATSYAVAFILCFLAFDGTPVPFAKTAHQLASKTYGIYLLHGKVMEFVARVVRQLVPWMLAHQLVSFQPLLFTFGLGVPLLIMASVARFPARRFYRYLFG